MGVRLDVQITNFLSFGTDCGSLLRNACLDAVRHPNLAVKAAGGIARYLARLEGVGGKTAIKFGQPG